MRGTLPTELGLLTNLKVLAVGGCRFNGTIPEHLFNLTRVEKLHLSMNLFSGRISSGVRNLNSIKELMISRTLITGSLPTELGILTSIENMEMYGNQLTGKIPSSLGNCTNLKRIGKNLSILHYFGQNYAGHLKLLSSLILIIRLIQQQTNWNDSRNTVSVAIPTNPARQTKSIDRDDLSQFRQASIFILV
jgi:Leucine-rich repeat (LRR) protein